MSERSALLTRRQSAALIFASLVSPLIRQLPAAAIRSAGGAAWASCFLSLLPACLLCLLVFSFFRRAAEGESLCDRLCAALGGTAGRIALACAALWMLLYLGFVLRAGAERFVGAVYRSSRSTPFILVAALLTGLAGYGSPKSLGRFAELVAPALALLFAAVLAMVLPQIDFSNLLPVTRRNAVSVLLGVAPAADTLAVGLYALFLSGHTPRRRLLLSAAVLPGLLAAALAAAILGVFGAGLAAKLEYPFFVMLRSLRFADLLERVEAVLIAQWVFTDFLLGTILLRGAVAALTRVFSLDSGSMPRCLPVILLTAATAFAFLCAPTVFSLDRLGAFVMPLGNAVLLYGLLPLAWLIGRLRHTI